MLAMIRLAALAIPLLAGPALALDVAPIWSKKCASCHGETGDGNTKMGQKHKIDDLTKAAWHANPKHSDESIRNAITNGVNGTKMAAFKEKLSAEEIDALVLFVRGLKKG